MGACGAAFCAWSRGGSGGWCMLLSVGHKQFAVEGKGHLVFVHLLSTMKVRNCFFILKLKRKHISSWFCC